jgi:hypothetical protein
LRQIDIEDGMVRTREEPNNMNFFFDSDKKNEKKKP